jgi:prophage regulatory protein
MSATIQAPTRHILRMPALVEKTGLARSTLYLLIQRGEFPKPRKITGSRTSGWDSLEVQAWIDARLGGAA